MKEQFNLPNFLIIGAAKCGTTSIHNYLGQHPEVFTSPTKEPHFFADFDPNKLAEHSFKYGHNKVQNSSDYYRLFNDSADYKIRMESSVSTLFYSKAMIKAKEMLGNPKVLIVLRNPIDRAYSNYMHHVRDENETLSFEDALNQENQRANESYWWGYQYKKVGLYFEQVEMALKTFGLENVMVVLFEDFLNSKAEVLCDLCNFIKIDENFQFDTSSIGNKTGVPKHKWKSSLFKTIANNNSILKKVYRLLLPSEKRVQLHNSLKNNLHNKNLVKPELILETRIELANFFKPDVINLQNLINKDLSHWLK
jgi:hypothetical protein